MNTRPPARGTRHGTSTQHGNPARHEPPSTAHPARHEAHTGHSAPHPPLLDYHPAAQDRDGFVRNLFNQTAGSYDRIKSAFSLG